MLPHKDGLRVRQVSLFLLLVVFLINYFMNVLGLLLRVQVNMHTCPNFVHSFSLVELTFSHHLEVA